MKKDKQRQTGRKKTRKIKIIPLTGMILLLFGFIIYSNTFNASFHWDDEKQIVANDKVHDLSFFSDPGTWTSVNMRPLSLFTFSLNWAVGEENVTGYHLLNLLFHILTAFFVFLLVKFTIGLLDKDTGYDQRLKNISAVFVAVLFLVHPLQTMAVTYIIQRMTVLAALFYILAVLLYAKGRMSYLSHGISSKSVALLVLAFLSGILGVLSKQNAVTFPAAFILYELFFIRKANGRMCMKYIIAGASTLILVFLLVVVSGMLPAETANFSRVEYLSAQLGIFHKYILLILFPLSQNVDYFIRVEPPLFGGFQVLGTALVLALAGVGVYQFRRNKLISFGIFWFMLSMSVESGLIPIRDIMMEHRMYLPIFGFGMVLAGLIMRYVPYRSLTSLNIIGFVIVLLMAFGTYNRNKVWENDISLWEDCLDKNPENPRAMNNLGLAIKINADHASSIHQRNMELNKAIGYYTSSMQCDTIFAQAYLNRGLAWFELGEYSKALKDINTVAEKTPKEEYLKYYIQGVAFAKEGNIKAASDNLDHAAGLNDEFAPLYAWLGLVNAEMKRYEKALDNYLFSIKLNPDQSILFINISNMYFYLRDYGQALTWINKARDAGEQVDMEYIQKLEEVVSGRRTN